jgi:hypothetical protein
MKYNLSIKICFLNIFQIPVVIDVVNEIISPKANMYDAG